MLFLPFRPKKNEITQIRVEVDAMKFCDADALHGCTTTHPLPYSIILFLQIPKLCLPEESKKPETELSLYQEDYEERPKRIPIPINVFVTMTREMTSICIAFWNIFVYMGLLSILHHCLFNACSYSYSFFCFSCLHLAVPLFSSYVF
ncbi:hypothetical protein BDV18DRAFT_23956 [Aspergillus unguis]